MTKKCFISDENFLIYPIVESDRENYTELHRQINGETTLFLNPLTKDAMWEQTLCGETKVFSVFSRNNEYCGSIELQRPDEKNPELGIDLIEQKRNQGIAKRVINMFVQEWCRTHNVEYFLIRISSRNSHSRHVFEKMGVVKLGTAESSFKSLVRELSERIGEDNLNELYDALKKFMGEADEVEEEIVYEYKLIPNEG